MVRRVTRTSSQDLKHLLLAPAGGRFVRPLDSYDEICPGVLLGDATAGLSTNMLKSLGVTHLINTAKGSNDNYYAGYINTTDSYYDRSGIKFMGIPALDTPSFYLKSYFRDAAEFIDDAVKSRGKVLVHCQCGISRSATLVAAYLMLKKGMDLQQALTTIRSRRSIFPNQGFLSQLCDFEYELRREGTLSAPIVPVEYDDTIDYKDSLKKSSGNRFPQFSDTNYFPLRVALSKSGYTVSSALPTIQRALETTYRARSEERIPSSYRDRSPSPPRYRSARATSVLPEAISYYEARRNAAPEPPSTVISTYDITKPYKESYSYLRLNRPFQYSPPRPVSKLYPTGYRALEQLASIAQNRANIIPSLDRTLTPRDRSYYTPTPYESYSYVSPSYQRSYSTYTPTSTYIPRSYAAYTPAPSYRLGYVPSVCKYPSLLSPSLYSRIYKA